MCFWWIIQEWYWFCKFPSLTVGKIKNCCNATVYRLYGIYHNLKIFNLFWHYYRAKQIIWQRKYSVYKGLVALIKNTAIKRPDACYGAHWRLLRPDFHWQAVDSLQNTRLSPVRLVPCLAHQKKALEKIKCLLYNQDRKVIRYKIWCPQYSWL